MQLTALAAIEQLLSTSPAPVAPAAQDKAAFATRFTAELARLERMHREPEAWEVENLLSALGAAAVEEFELACAFLDAVPDRRAAMSRHANRTPTLSVATLRRRFEQMCA